MSKYIRVNKLIRNGKNILNTGDVNSLFNISEEVRPTQKIYLLEKDEKIVANHIDVEKLSIEDLILYRDNINNLITTKFETLKARI
jgi:hypothetical protein|tara:strand:- start:1878 stop:2135 length:258 start_codon:yes stop_codon:yes gene_type:complete